jgi:hypothetical protein
MRLRTRRTKRTLATRRQRDIPEIDTWVASIVLCKSF